MVVTICVLGASLGGCAIFADPNAWPQKFAYGDSATLASSGSVRYVNERERSMLGREDRPLGTMCTEPSPDVAVAFGTSLAAQATVNGQGSGSFSAGTTEQATALAGRTAGVLALRDGLYATCQAYANGALGQSAYALGLSQYGNLLVALTSTAGTDANGKPLPNTASAAINTPDQSAAAALMVACISEYDPTRQGALNPKTGQIVTSRVLDQGFCQTYIKAFGYKLTAVPVAKPPPAPKARPGGGA
jgi:hypothetical protein